MVTQRDIENIKWQLEELDDIQEAGEILEILKRTIERLLLVNKNK